MKCISVHIQPGLNHTHRVEELIELVRSVDRYPELESGADYVNLHFFTEDLALFWKEFESRVLGDKVLGKWLAEVAIIASGNDAGDELLLYHFDKNEELDCL